MDASSSDADLAWRLQMEEIGSSSQMQQDRHHRANNMPVPASSALSPAAAQTRTSPAQPSSSIASSKCRKCNRGFNMSWTGMTGRYVELSGGERYHIDCLRCAGKN